METAQRRQTISKLSRIPGYAGGGFIDGLKQAVGMAPPETMIQKFARQDAERAAKQKPVAQPTEQAQPPKPDNAIGNYVGNTALQAREKAAGLAGGGPVEGEGGPTEDNIPIKASVGEFMIRAAAVKEIGLPALRAINALGGNLPKSPNRKDNKYAEGDVVKEREALVAQIPTGGTGTGPTPQPDPTQSASGTELGRNVNNAISALAPLSGGTALVNGASRLGAALGTSATAGKIATGVAQAMPYATPAAGAIGLSMASSPSAAPVTQAQQQLAGALPTSQPSAPTSAPAPAPTPVAIPTLDGAEGKDLGNGIKRFDVEGKSPLFTNRTDAVGMADNAALTNRAPMTAQNQMAMQGIQDRQDAGDKARAAQSQYEQEVAQAQAINQGQKEYHLQHDAASGNSSQRKAALAALANISTAATTKANNAVSMRGQDVTSRGQDLTANAASASQRLARDQFGLSQAKDGRESAASAMDIKARQQLMDAQQEYLAAGDDPVKQKAAERKLSTLGIKQAQDEYAYAPGGQSVVDGQLVTQPGVVFNKRTGQPAQAGKSIQSDQRALAIKNNANLTREQKVAELQKIGFQ